MVLLAKITPPACHELMARPRLSCFLARNGQPCITWIVGPPGAGKTSLAVSYLPQRKGARLWFQVDAGDRDPAAFFAGLGEALRRGSRRVKPGLLAFGPEYSQDLLTYARRFFEGFYQRLAPGSVLVLDNYQDIPAAAPVHDMLREGLSFLPPGIQVLVLSRQAPPAGFARLQAHGQLGVLGWPDLRMTDAEALALLRARATGPLDAVQAVELCRLADGWPAGLVLLAAENWAGHGFVQGLPGTDRELLFGYFANEVFKESAADQRSMLMQVALLSRCSAAQAQDLTGWDEAGSRLAAMAKAGYFTVVHGTTHPAYEFHPLFREFLLQQAAIALPPSAWREAQFRAARMLEREGQIEEAFDLFQALGAQEQQIRLITMQAMPLLAQSRHHTLLALLAALPAGCVEQHSWLSLWQGVGLMPVDLQGSRAHLERAFAAFGREGNSTGQLLAWCSAVDTCCYGFDGYAPLDSWIEWLDRHQEVYADLEDPASAEALTVSRAWAMMYRQPDHPGLLAEVQRAERILHSGLSMQTRLRAGTVAMLYRFTMGEQVACSVLLGAIRRLAESMQEPLALVTSCWAESFVLTWSGLEPVRSQKVIEEGLDLGTRYGIHFGGFSFHGFAAANALAMGDLGSAERSLAAMLPKLPGHHARALFHLLSAWTAFLGNQLQSAHAHAVFAVQEAEASGHPFSQVETRLTLADLLFELGRPGEAQAQMCLVRDLLDRVHWPFLEMLFHQGAARHALSASPADPGPALDHLRQALALKREYQLLDFRRFWFKPEWMTLLCATALEHGIETAFVQRMIRAHGILPPNPAGPCPDWPWEIRITTLGRFSIERNGQPLVFSRKAPWRVLLMLKALIAAGPQGIGDDRLADCLWPDADGDTARLSLDTTLHRLRQLLGPDGLITLRDGRLALDGQRCWVDAHAFEQLVDSNDSRPAAVTAYTGAFMEGLDTPWANDYRDLLRRKLVRAVLALGENREKASAFHEALAWYERGLAADPLAEGLYHRIMVCHATIGSRAEGLRSFETCRRLLKAHLDAAPSQETVALAATLRD